MILYFWCILSLKKKRPVSASKAKLEFLANMRHKLRTPLNSIIGFSELMKQKVSGGLSEKQEHYLDNILINSRQLLDVINDVFDLIRIETDNMELNIETFSVPLALDETISLFKEKASKHKVILKNELDPQLELIESDQNKFRQVLFNLLDNAVKFSKDEGGTVIIKTRKLEDTIQVSISDTGIGIRETDMDKLFKTFELVDMGITKKYDGTGLGLVISKYLVEMQGGKIRAESKFGEGSTFTFLLPLHQGKGIK
jgi:signal transduction histidine kinase